MLEFKVSPSATYLVFLNNVGGVGTHNGVCAAARVCGGAKPASRRDADRPQRGRRRRFAPEASPLHCVRANADRGESGKSAGLCAASG